MDLQELQRAFARGGVPSAPVGSIGHIPSGAQVPEVVSKCAALRVQIAGGKLLELATHPSLTPLEQIYRKLPVNGTFTAVPSRPFVIELGAFTVPRSMLLLALDFRFDVYRFSGAVVSDTVPMESRRLSTVIGHEVRFSVQHTSNLRYEVVPSLPSASKEAFEGQPNAGIIPGGGPSRATQNQFDQAAFQQQQGPAGQGLSMMPNRHRRDSQFAMPFTYVVPPGQRVQMRTVIFQPLAIPIAFFEGEFSGLLIGQNVLQEFLDGMAPCGEGKK